MIRKFSTYNETFFKHKKIKLFKPRKIEKREKEVISKGLFLHKFVSDCKIIFEKKMVNDMSINDGEEVTAHIQSVTNILHNPLRLYNKCKIWNLVEGICYREGSMTCDAYIENNEITKVVTNVDNILFPNIVIAKDMCHYLISQCLYHIEEFKNLNQGDRLKIQKMIQSETIKMVKELQDLEKIC